MDSAAVGKKYHKLLIGAVLALCVAGIIMRFYHIARNDFVFYDEGYYLNHNRLFAQLITDNYPTNFWDFWKAFYTYIRFSLASGKALWFMIVDFRIFLGGMNLWFFPKVVAAISGALTLLVIFRFAKRYYGSDTVAWLSVGILALFPSHVFYSRVGLQETFSTLLVLAGFYFYLFPRRFGWRTFLSGVIFAAAFFANYRLIILPALIAFCEFYFAVVERRAPDIRKFIWSALTFGACVVLIGNVDDAQNTIITFAWIFHQADLAPQEFDWVNLLSFPYYLFRMENWTFGLLFFANIYLLFQKQWAKLFPFFLAVCQMMIFSFASEKGARYLCVMIPFLVMSVAYLIDFLARQLKEDVARFVLALSVVLMVGFFFVKSLSLTRIHSDYRNAAEFLLERDPNVKFLSTQNYVHNLYVPYKKNVEATPHSFEELFLRYSQGFTYMIIEPQAYISWTKDQTRFLPVLDGHLSFVMSTVQPVITFTHFNDTMMERFVFEHSENLVRSIQFLRMNREGRFGRLLVYDIADVIKVTVAALSHYQKPTP